MSANRIKVKDHLWHMSAFKVQSTGDSITLGSVTFDIEIPALCVADISAFLLIGPGATREFAKAVLLGALATDDYKIFRVIDVHGENEGPDFQMHHIFDPNTLTPADRLTPETWRLTGPGRFRLTMDSTVAKAGVAAYWQYCAVDISPAQYTPCPEDFDKLAQELSVRVR